MRAFAQKGCFFGASFWALIFCFALVGISSGSCHRTKTLLEPVAFEQSLEINQESMASASLKNFASGCLDEKKITIKAHFLEQTMNEALCFEDVIRDQSSSMSCSPGPYLNKGRASDKNGDVWELRSTPDYFSWHQSTNFPYQNFVITNEKGFPIKSQVIRLQNEAETALVLFPKAVLNEGSTYYMYIRLEQDGARQTWIQPLVIKNKG